MVTIFKVTFKSPSPSQGSIHNFTLSPYPMIKWFERFLLDWAIGMFPLTFGRCTRVY